MDLPSLLQRSTLLSAEEKAYWMQMLPVMDAKKKEKLQTILTQAEQIPLKEHVQAYYAHVAA